MSLAVLLDPLVQRSQMESFILSLQHTVGCLPCSKVSKVTNIHLLIEAELAEDIINSRLEHAVQFLESLLKPVDKREQLKVLGALNGTLREESPSLRLSPTASVPRLENKDFYRRDERLQFICFLVIKFILYF